MRLVPTLPFKLKARLVAGVSVACMMMTQPAFAFSIIEDMPLSQLFLGTLTLGVSVFAIYASLAWQKLRSSGAKDVALLKYALEEKSKRVLEVERLLYADNQCRIAWDNANGQPRVMGDIARLFPQLSASQLPMFNLWLDDKEQSELENHLIRFRSHGKTFRLELKTRNNGMIEAEGVTAGGVALLQLRPLSHLQQQLQDNQKLLSENASALAQLEHFLNVLPHPVWLRDEVGRLKFVNNAFAKAVEQPEASSAILANMDFFDQAVRSQISTARVANQSYQGFVNATAAGARRTYEVLDNPFQWGSAGLAVDMTETERLRREKLNAYASQRQVFDLLGAAVATFDTDKKLVFYNSSYAKLWGLETKFLDDKPSDGDILDRLHDARKLPEQPNYRAWKEKLHSLYITPSLEPLEEQWYLPDQSSFRMVQIPHKEGGVTYVFEDLTQKLELEMRYSALNRIQRETLENLSEAVAVFSSNGKLSLWNQSYADMWQLNRDLLAGKPHIDQLNKWCQRLSVNKEAFDHIRAQIVSLAVARTEYSERIETTDKNIIDMLCVSLPDGGTLLTFRNVTIEVDGEKLLLERNNALVAADAQKTEFVKNVSVALRTPLTSVIGYIELLDAFSTDMKPQQRDYVGNISTSAKELNNVIGSILDFASIDAGNILLKKQSHLVKDAVLQAAAALKHKRKDDNIQLGLEMTQENMMILADSERLNQILYHVMSNGIQFAKGSVRVRISQDDDFTTINVVDDGVGIDEKVLADVFSPFLRSSSGTSHRGVGLGLSITKALIELHGGTIDVQSKQGEGTIVSLKFPRIG